MLTHEPDAVCLFSFLVLLSNRLFLSYFECIIIDSKRVNCNNNLQTIPKPIGEQLWQQRKDSNSDGEWLYQEEMVVSLN